MYVVNYLPAISRINLCSVRPHPSSAVRNYVENMSAIHSLVVAGREIGYPFVHLANRAVPLTIFAVAWLTVPTI